jgi:hypothetical protein
MDYKVLITTSGIGSRLGDFTKYTNKTLLRVGQKPVISHIIEGYPKETKFVVTIGYFGNQVKDFLEIAYPDRFFEFVQVDNFQGEGSSLLYSMTRAKDKLQIPFIFHASDTIVLENLPVPEFNWNAGFKGPGSSHYTSFDVLGNFIKVFYDKGNLSPDFLHVGILGINNYKLFWEIADSVLKENAYASSLSDVDVLKRLLLQDKVQEYELKTWFDIGNVEKIKEAQNYFAKKDFHVLDKVTESIYQVEGHVIKFFYDEVICQNRVRRTEYLNGVVPEIVASKPNFYKYGYVRGELFSNIANRSNFNVFLKWVEGNMWKPVQNIGNDRFREISRDFYYNKTLKRIAEMQASRGIEDKVDIINGQTIPTISDLIAQVDFDWLSGSQPTTFHGDFILDNIIYQGNGKFKLIDWRQDFGGEIEAGDEYYDLAKLSHNLIVNHEMIDDNYFQVEIDEKGEVHVNIFRLQSLVDCENVFFKYLEEKGIDVNKVKLLRSIIWLNMSPLHHHPFDLFLYYFGKYSLFSQLKDMKNEI